MNETKETFTVKNIPAELLKQARIIAIEQDKPLSEVIRELLKGWVNEQTK